MMTNAAIVIPIRLRMTSAPMIHRSVVFIWDIRYTIYARSNQSGPYFPRGARESAPASWSAAALCRSFTCPVDETKAAEGCRTPGRCRVACYHHTNLEGAADDPPPT